ncbi:MAG: hypothetical protein Q9216_002881 [Gyalolechia sp. 2 TL-2023]
MLVVAHGGSQHQRDQNPFHCSAEDLLHRAPQSLEGKRTKIADITVPTIVLALYATMHLQPSPPGKPASTCVPSLGPIADTDESQVWLIAGLDVALETVIIYNKVNGAILGADKSRGLLIN